MKNHFSDVVYYEQYKESSMGSKKTSKATAPKTSKTEVTTSTSAVKRTETPKVSFKQRVNDFVTTVKARFNTLVSKLKPAKKKRQKRTKAEQLAFKEQRKHGILGIGLLLTVVSIVFSTYVTITFVDGSAVYIALAPQVAFALFSLIKAFSKIYK